MSIQTMSNLLAALDTSRTYYTVAEGLDILRVALLIEMQIPALGNLISTDLSSGPGWVRFREDSTCDGGHKELDRCSTYKKYKNRTSWVYTTYMEMLQGCYQSLGMLLAKAFSRAKL